MAYTVWRQGADSRLAYTRFVDPLTGKERQVTADTDSPHIAELHRQRIERDLEGRGPKDPRVLPDAALERWFEHLRAQGRSEGTIRGYASKVGQLAREWRGRPLHTWEARDVGRWVETRRGASSSTRRAFLVSSATFLKWCRAEGLPVRPSLADDVRLLERPSVRITDRDVLTEAQVGALLSAARGTVLEPAVALSGLAGLTLGDVRALRWDELDLDGGTLWRRQGRAKTGERLRVPLAPQVVEVLRRHRHAGPLVCRLPGETALRGALARLHEAAAVPRPAKEGWHRLRHSFASSLAARGVPLPVLRALMGHSPGSTVTLRYLHPVTDQMRAAVADLGAAVVARPQGAIDRRG